MKLTNAHTLRSKSVLRCAMYKDWVKPGSLSKINLNRDLEDSGGCFSNIPRKRSAVM